MVSSGFEVGVKVVSFNKSRLIVLDFIIPEMSGFEVCYSKKNHMENKTDKTVDDYKKIILNGENEEVEFKSSLRWDVNKKEDNKGLEIAIVKTIQAFLNTKGGTLFIGISDEGDILGIENDYTILPKQNWDNFSRKLSEIINNYLGKICHEYIKIYKNSLEGKEICIIEVYPSDEPVYFKKGNDDKFYIRINSSSFDLVKQETSEYIKKHFNSTKLAKFKPIHLILLSITIIAIVLSTFLYFTSQNDHAINYSSGTESELFENSVDQIRTNKKIREGWEKIKKEAVAAKNIMLSDREKGEELFRELIKTYGDDGMIYYEFGEAYEILGENDLAIEYYLKAEKEYPLQRYKDKAQRKYLKLNKPKNN